MTDAAAPALEFDQVIKAFRAPDGGMVTVLDRVSFSLSRGGFTAVVGPSGCGKTTLLHLAAGLSEPSAGVLRQSGKPIAGISGRIGYVTQEAKLFPWFTLAENVELPLKLRGVPAAERAARVRAALRLVGLEGFERHYPHQLSGGMQKRGSIVRTLVYEPEVVLMDEPFGALDAQTRMVMQNELLALWQRQRTSILFITHDLTEAVVMADRVVLLGKQPTRVKSTIEVPIARPRAVFEPFGMKGFVETYEKVWAAFKDEIAPEARAERRP